MNLSILTRPLFPFPATAITHRRPIPLALALILPAMAGDIPAPQTSPTLSTGPDAWTRFNDWSIGDVLFPALHVHGVGGVCSTDPAALASGAHDPNREAFSAQAIEPAVSLRTRYLEAFANHIFFQDGHSDWGNEWEEAFAKLTNLPGGFELKGGQFLSRYGALNDKHLHAWDFVDSETVLSRFLGEHGMLLQGAELSWTLPFNADPTFVSIASVGSTWSPHLDTGLRLGWVEGVSDFGQDQRFRVSPGVTYWFDSERRIGLRTQYNFDRVVGGGNEHSVWFQLNLALGSTAEVR